MTDQHDIEKLNRDNFRSSLEALARPGRPQPIIPLFGSGLLAMASVLLYAEVSYCYDGKCDFQLITAICGTKVAPKTEADYLFFDAPDGGCLENVKIGTPESPEFGATLIIGYRSRENSGLEVSLTGPGISGRKEVQLPVSPEFISRLQEINESFPMGVDLFFVDERNTLIGLPRTTAIEVLA